MPYVLTQAQRSRYSQTSARASERKRASLARLDEGFTATTQLGQRLDPNSLMPYVANHGLSCLSLFSGGGGLDLGFERAGFNHIALYELLDVCGQTLRANRPHWDVNSGTEDGDVRIVPFSRYRGIDVIHGGPPCQPFSIAGKQAGANDPRNMWGEFVRSVLQVRPRAFVAENVVGLLDQKFESFVNRTILEPLQQHYTIFKFVLAANEFGVPQARRRVFFVGFRAKRDAARYSMPSPTHGSGDNLNPTNTARRSLGLPDIGIDDAAPTLRSGFTGPRNTTGVVNSKASMGIWDALRIWPNGVQRSRLLADAFPPENGHFRLSVEDCALLQGFPKDWHFSGAVYQALGQIGNSVCPPVAYAVAKSVSLALRS